MTDDGKQISRLFLVKVFVFALSAAELCRGEDCVKNTTSVEKILEQLRVNVAALKTYHCDIEYLFDQPLFDSETLRSGKLFYKKYNDKSALRINFITLKQDDEKEKPYKEDYIFDGVWLTHIDYQLKQVKRYQQAEPNQPIDAFELAAKSFPIIGFGKTEDLKKNFEIKLCEQHKNNQSISTKLCLKTKENSAYKNNYTSVEFWIDKKSSLPARIRTVSVEEDIYRIELTAAEVNKKIDEKVFEIKIPDGFESKETEIRQQSGQK